MIFIKLFFIISCLLSSVYASEKTRIFILHSYSQEYPWTKSQHDAFVKTLLADTTHEFEFYIEYLDTKRVNFTHHYQEHFVEYLRGKYQDTGVDLIYTTDDNALTFMYENYEKLFSKGEKKPVFFSGVNNLEMAKILPKKSFVGVYEVKEIAKNIELIKQFSPQTRDIYFVGDSSQTSKFIEKEIQKEQHYYENMHFHFISDKYISKLSEKLPNRPRNFVLLTTIGHLNDDSNNTLLLSESIQKIKQHRNLILLTMEDAYMLDGVVGGYVTSGSAQGREAAKLLLEYLKSNSLNAVKSLKNSPNIYMFNSKELTKSRVVLSEYIARDAVIIAEDKQAIFKKQSALLSILTIIIILLIFGMIVIYAMYRKKIKQNMHKELIQKLERVKLKLSAKDQFINYMMKFEDVGYWRLDLKKEELFLSRKLLEVLSIDNEIYKNDTEAISYFVHESDKALFYANLEEVKKEHNSVLFKHKMVSTDKKLFNVKHIIYFQYDGHALSPIIFGIIKFEN